MRDLLDLPIVGDVRGRGFFWAIERVKDDANTRFDQGERDRLLARGSSPIACSTRASSPRRRPRRQRSADCAGTDQ